MASVRLGLLFTLIPACATAGPVPEKTFSAMAFNVLYSGADDQASIEAIENESADIVCLQELTPKFSKRFKKKLGDEYRYRRFRPKRGTWGVGIASRYPISKFRVFPQKPHRIPAAEAVIKMGSKSVTVVCIHFMPPFAKHKKSDGYLTTMSKNAELRVAQAAYLLSRFKKKKTVLILGDFNEEAGDDAIESLTSAGFRDACALPHVRCTPTWPGATSYFPALTQIDHVLGRGVIFTDAHTVRDGGSDHFPVVARFGFP